MEEAGKNFVRSSGAREKERKRKKEKENEKKKKKERKEGTKIREKKELYTVKYWPAL